MIEKSLALGFKLRATKTYKWMVRIASVLCAIAYSHLFIHNARTSFDFGIMPIIMGVLIAVTCNLGLWLTSTSFFDRHRIITGVMLVPSFTITPLVVDHYHGFFLFLNVVMIIYILCALLQRKYVQIP